MKIELVKIQSPGSPGGFIYEPAVTFEGSGLVLCDDDREWLVCRRDPDGIVRMTGCYLSESDMRNLREVPLLPGDLKELQAAYDTEGEERDDLCPHCNGSGLK